MHSSNSAKVLLFDIETTPNVSYTWGVYEQDVIQVREPWRILCVAYKWLHEDKIHFLSTKGQKDDKSLCKKLYDILSCADVIVAHNGDAFDIKKSCARFLVHGLPALKHLSSIDTKKEAKRRFNFCSNKLNDLGELLGLGKKEKHTGFDLWLGCMSNDADSWSLMERYNKQDVRLLEKVYLKLRPWIRSHPLMRDDRDGCPKCGSDRVQSRGTRRNAASISRQMWCRDCDGWYVIPIKRKSVF